MGRWRGWSPSSMSVNPDINNISPKKVQVTVPDFAWIWCAYIWSWSVFGGASLAIHLIIRFLVLSKITVEADVSFGHTWVSWSSTFFWSWGIYVKDSATASIFQFLFLFLPYILKKKKSKFIRLPSNSLFCCVLIVVTGGPNPFWVRTKLTIFVLLVNLVSLLATAWPLNIGDDIYISFLFIVIHLKLRKYLFLSSLWCLSFFLSFCFLWLLFHLFYGTHFLDGKSVLYKFSVALKGFLSGS